MRTFIYLKEAKEKNLLAEVNLEVVPRGAYEIDGVSYKLTGQPKFVIGKKHPFYGYILQSVELIVEKDNG